MQPPQNPTINDVHVQSRQHHQQETMAGPRNCNYQDTQSLSVSVHSNSTEADTHHQTDTNYPPTTTKRSSILDRMKVFEKNSTGTLPTLSGSSFLSMDDNDASTRNTAPSLQSPDVFRKIVGAAGTTPIQSPDLGWKPSVTSFGKKQQGGSRSSSISTDSAGGRSSSISDDEDDDVSIKIMDVCNRLSESTSWEEPSEGMSSSKRGSLVEIARVFEPTISEGSFRTLDSSMRSLDGEQHLRKIQDYSKEPVTPGSSFANSSYVTPYHYVSPSLTVPRRASLVTAIKEGMFEEDLLDKEDSADDNESPPPFGEPVILKKRDSYGTSSNFLTKDREVEQQKEEDCRPHLPFGVTLRKTTGPRPVPIMGQNPAPQRTQREKDIFDNVCAPTLTLDPETFQAPCYSKTQSQRELIQDAIKHTFVLKDNKDATEESLIRAMESVRLPHGGVLAQQGHTSPDDDHFYVVEEGRVEFEVNGVTVGSALPGTSFGQERLLLRGPNVATVKASTEEDVKLFRLDQMTFRSIMIQHQQLPESAIRAQKLAQAQAAIEAEEAAAQKEEEDEAIQFVQELALQESAVFQRQKTIRQSVQGNVAFQDLEKISILGEGQFGEVWLVAANVPGMEEAQIDERQEFALKIQHKQDDIRDDAVGAIRREIDILQQIHHPFIVDLVNVYESEDSIDMLMGLITGGELWDVIHKELPDGEWTSGIPETHAKFYSWIITDTLAYIHQRQFVFRDLKPENVMLDEDGYPVLVDFGFAKHVPKDGLTFTFCGTPNYVAPEIIKTTGHNAGVDYWALGVLIYEMIAGENPFYFDGMEQLALFQAIAEETYYAMPEDKAASRLVSDLLDRLLEKEYTERLGMLQGGAQDILNHSWYAGLDAAKLRNKDVKAPWIPGQEEPADPAYEIECTTDDKEGEDGVAVEEILSEEEEEYEEEVIEDEIVEEVIMNPPVPSLDEAKAKRDSNLAKEGWTKVVATPRMNPAPSKDHPLPQRSIETDRKVEKALPREEETTAAKEEKKEDPVSDNSDAPNDGERTPTRKSRFSTPGTQIYRRESKDYDGLFKHRKSPEARRSSKNRRNIVSDALQAYLAESGVDQDSFLS